MAKDALVMNDIQKDSPQRYPAVSFLKHQATRISLRLKRSKFKKTFSKHTFGILSTTMPSSSTTKLKNVTYLRIQS